MARSQMLLKLTVLTISVFILTVLARVIFVDVYSMQLNYSSSSNTLFNISHSLQLPYRSKVRSVDEILETQWAPELWRHLSELDTKYVSLCIGNSAYKESIVNWLIAALVITQPPLENVLVISLDTKLHEFLQGHDINSVFIDPWTILRSDVKLATNFSHIWVTRLVLFRLINHWGYTVATYDSDAIPVKNPQTLFAKFEDSDLVGSRGTYPFNLHRQWKSATMCMGVTLFRASEGTEKFWTALSDVQDSMGIFDDQVIINNVLEWCGIEWTTTDTSINGTCRDLKLKVTLLPSSVVCRKCTKTSGYYVWHEMGARVQEDKRDTAMKGGTWFLKQSLNGNDLIGIQWLRFLNSDKI